MHQFKRYTTVWLGGRPRKESIANIEWVTSFVLASFLLLISCTKEGPTGVDTQAPTVTVTSPASNTAVSGLVTISVEAEDNEGVVRVEFHIDGELRFTDEASPWEYSWETFFYENGTRHGIVVKAYDKAGNSGSSDEVRVVVYNEINEPPTATILLPPDSASFVLGEEVILQGDGRDALGNPLREDQLTWLSRREGEVPTLLGIGTYLTTDTLTAGWHTITLIATDDNQLTGRDSTAIHVAAEAEILQITHDGFSESFPCWSPDGQRIAFTSNRSGNSDIWIVPIGDLPTQLTVDPADDWDPAWHGSTIAFTSFRSGNPDIWKISEGGTDPVRLTTDPGWDTGVSWSPDGQYFVVSSQMGEPLMHLWILPISAGDSTKLTTEAGYGPDWLWGEDVAFQGLDQNIYVTSPVSMVPIQITWDPAVDRSPSWSPNGDAIAFSSDRSGNEDIWIWSHYDEQIRQLTFHSGRDYDPAWSPNGQWIAFASDRDGNSDIWIIRVQP